MPAEKGSAFLLKVGDGGLPPVYATIVGLRTTQLSINGDAVVITNKDSGAWRELLSGAGVRSVSVSGAGVFTGSVAETRIKSNALSGACLSTTQAQRLVALNWRQQNRSKAKSVAIEPLRANLPATAETRAGSVHKISEIEYLRGCMRISSQGWINTESLSSAQSDPGRDVAAPDLAVGETLLQLIDLPAVSEPLPSQPVVGVAAAGTGPAWRKAALACRDGTALKELGRTAPAAVIGWSQGAISSHPAHLLDNSTVLRLKVHHEGMDLPPGYGDPLHPDAPVIHVDGEFIKYGDCAQIGPLEFLLTRLVRGSFGSEPLAKPVGTSFCYLDKATTLQFNDLGLVSDDSAAFEAVGIGDSGPVQSSLPAIGRAIRPLPPCHLEVTFDQTQGMSVNWRRRSRLDTGWRDYADLPLDEAQLAFEVTVETGQQLLATYQVGGEALEIPQTTISAWGLTTGASLTAGVRQRGANAVSAAIFHSLVL